MALKDLTDSSAVLQALDLFDRMGREDFLKKYGFGAAKSYMLLDQGKLYDSKAIAGVAHLIQHGELLEPDQFTGGVQGAAQALAKLGFEVIKNPAPRIAPPIGSSFEVLWNPANFHWDDEFFRDMQHQIEAGSSVPYSWSIGVRKTGIEPGARIYMFHVGSKNRGLIASGHATSLIYQLPHWDETRTDTANYIDVSWDILLDPADLLPWDEVQIHVPGFPKVFMSGGVCINPSQSEALELLWQDHVERAAIASTTVPGESITKGYKYYLAKHRIHQKSFRALLLKTSEPKCIICGLNEIPLLEAAHLIPDSQGGLPTIENGRLMCANHHKAYDTHYFTLDDNDKPIWVDGIEPF
ncbi:HNH endonuclease [Glutamicibacter arilaitensis]|uniref:HNH endonuclease n=1 Tax=Glutamicibacter arilaitensis TaxID=256701 RepID=UPI003F91CABB